MSNISKSYSSPLVTRVVPCVTNDWQKRVHNVKFITLHHCAGWFDNSLHHLTKNKTYTSAHFLINNNEVVLMNGPSERACWSDANEWYNERTVSIEMTNSSLAPNWGISEGTLRKTAELVADLARFYGLGKLTLNKNVVLHKNVAAPHLPTSCPGPTGSARAQDIVNWANEINGHKASTSVSKPSTGSFLAKVTASALNVRSEPNTNSRINTVIRDKGTYTITDQKGAWGKLKSGAGWIHLDYTNRV